MAPKMELVFYFLETHLNVRLHCKSRHLALALLLSLKGYGRVIAKGQGSS